MVEPIEDGLKGFAQISEVHDPAGFPADRSADVDLDAERMSVHARALVPIGNVGQAVRSLDLENAKYIHGRIVPPVGERCNRA